MTLKDALIEPAFYVCKKLRTFRGMKKIIQKQERRAKSTILISVVHTYIYRESVECVSILQSVERICLCTLLSQCVSSVILFRKMQPREHLGLLHTSDEHPSSDPLIYRSHCSSNRTKQHRCCPPAPSTHNLQFLIDQHWN